VIKSVVFDVGETLLADTREFAAWADWIGVPRHTFSALMGAVTAAGRNNAETFQYLRPGFDLVAEREKRQAAWQRRADRLRRPLSPMYGPRAGRHFGLKGLWVGVARNQTTFMCFAALADRLPPGDGAQHNVVFLVSS
jgi:N-acetyl-D-muramate 6-phosphate phosphatase